MCSSAFCLHISANVWLHISVKPVVYLKYPLLMNRPKRYLFVYVFSLKVFFSLKNSSTGIFIFTTWTDFLHNNVTYKVFEI